MKTLRPIRVFAILTVLVFWAAGQAFCALNQKEEERMGSSAAQEVDRSSKLVTDPKVTARVDRVGQAMAAIAKKYRDPRALRMLASIQVQLQVQSNRRQRGQRLLLARGAYLHQYGTSQPDGYGRSIAGVLAHEVAHAAHHHVATLMKKQARMDKLSALVALAALLHQVRGSDLNNLLLGTQLLKNRHPEQLHPGSGKGRGQTAVSYLVRSQYNPQGMLEVMSQARGAGRAKSRAPAPAFIKITLPHTSARMPSSRRCWRRV